MAYKWQSNDYTKKISIKFKHLLPKDFDYQFYINTHEDLRSAGVDDEQKAIEHYILFGLKENRIFNNKDSDKPNKPWTIIYYYHEKPLHLDVLYNSNPSSQIIPLYTKNNLNKEEVWKNPDRILREKIIKNDIMSQVINDNVLLIEHDVYLNQELPNIEFDSMLTKYSDTNSNWYWWKEVELLPKEFKQYAIAGPIFGVMAIKKEVLHRTLDKKYDDFFNMSINCELRFPTIVKSLGYKPSAFPEYFCKYIKNGKDQAILMQEFVQNNHQSIKGVFHPVKSKIIYEKKNIEFEIKVEDPNFDPKLYKLYNKDLSNFSDEEATKHYIMHGKKEKRIYYKKISYKSLIKNKTSQKIPTNNPIFLINHDVSMTGAPIFLYDLYNYILSNNILDNVYILEDYPNKILPNFPNKIYHYNDIDYLKNIFNISQPSLIYSNSINFYLLNIYNFQSFHKKTILHFHETYNSIKHIIPKLQNHINQMPIFVVSEKIKQEFLKNHDFKIDVFPPFISQSKKQKIINLYDKKPKNLKNINKSKITIGMCGSLCDRKNIKLFLKISELYSQYNFVWIGGNKNELDIKNLPKNFTWVPYTNNPYKYFKLLDYFLLTSKEDPCPIVVLENLFLNKKLIVIKDNIKTDHKIKLLENYLSIDAEDEQDFIDKFGKLHLTKIPNKTNKNIKYIEKYYSEPEKILLNIKKIYEKIR